MKLSTSLKKMGTWVGNFYKCSFDGERRIKWLIFRQLFDRIKTAPAVLRRLMIMETGRRGLTRPHSGKWFCSDTGVQVRQYWIRCSSQPVSRQPHQNTKTRQPFLAWMVLQCYRLGYPFIIFITQISPWRRPNIFDQLAVPVLYALAPVQILKFSLSGIELVKQYYQ